eukprot:574062-Pelagomonas_calceolata.AAC.5
MKPADQGVGSAAAPGAGQGAAAQRGRPPMVGDGGLSWRMKVCEHLRTDVCLEAGHVLIGDWTYPSSIVQADHRRANAGRKHGRRGSVILERGSQNLWRASPSIWIGPP